MEKYILPKSELAEYVNKLKEEYEVFGPVSKDNKYVFQSIGDPQDLRLEYDTTILPPKKYFHSPEQIMMEFSGIADSVKEKEPVGKRLLIGVHPCDVNAILSLDRVFLNTYSDPYYKELRENTVIIANNCTQPCKDGFCASFNTGPGIENGFDIALTDIGSKYVMTVGSEKGKELVRDFDSASEKEITLEKKTLNDCLNNITRWIDDVENIGNFMHANFDHEVWMETKEECLACGACTTVCPTCYCFAVKDMVELCLQKGQRSRVWDSCMFYEFSRVALDHVFMADRTSRIKQRLYHKLAYTKQQFDVLGCVGCGRCVSICLKNIDPVEIIAKLKEEPCVPQDSCTYNPPQKDVSANHNPWLTEKAVIKAVKKITPEVNTYTFEFTSPNMKDYTFENGTYNMISIFGVGESPISISSSEEEKKSFDHTVRIVGNVTSALGKLHVGDIIGIRGPYGHGWPMEEMKGKNVLIIAGGIGLAPLRGVIKSIERNRDQYGRLEILYGSKTPESMLFTDEYGNWQKMPNTQLLLTVDCVGDNDDWKENIGVVTNLCDKITCSIDNTIVLACGPDVMMKYVVAKMLKLGFNPNQVFVSLERRMGCGMKKCGNCHIGPVFVCQDGPVFRYSDIMNLPGGVF